MRKAPRQERSRTMVNNILEAATRVFGDRGWAKFTTNEVAATAGISIGSLYQYFPSKLALAEAIRQRHLDAVLSALDAADCRDELDGPEGRVEKLIDGVIAVHSVDPRVHKGLLEDVPLASRSSLELFEQEYQRRYAAFIATSSDRPDPARDAVAGRVLAAAVEGVVHAAVRHGELKSKALRQELVLLVRGYIRERAFDE